MVKVLILHSWVSSFYLCHRHNDLDVESDGRRGHDDDQRLAGQHWEQGAAHGLTHDGVHHTDFTI